MIKAYRSKSKHDKVSKQLFQLVQLTTILLILGTMIDIFSSLIKTYHWHRTESVIKKETQSCNPTYKVDVRVSENGMQEYVKNMNMHF